MVVYLHWGAELESCPTRQQRATARALAEAGADIVVGTHAHVPLGSGWLGDTYVNYGLGNFLWYHDRRPESGVLQVRIEDGAVVDDAWVPAEIQPDGRPVPLTGADRAAAEADWRRLRGCTGLAEAPALAGPPGLLTHAPTVVGARRAGPRARCLLRDPRAGRLRPLGPRTSPSDSDGDRAAVPLRRARPGLRPRMRSELPAYRGIGATDRGGAP